MVVLVLQPCKPEEHCVCRVEMILLFSVELHRFLSDLWLRACVHAKFYMLHDFHYIGIQWKYDTHELSSIHLLYSLTLPDLVFIIVSSRISVACRNITGLCDVGKHRVHSMYVATYMSIIIVITRLIMCICTSKGTETHFL